MDSGVEAVVVSALECIRLDHNYSCFIQSPQFGKRVDSATDTTTSGNESTYNDVIKSESDNDQDESTVEIPTENTKTIIPKQPTRGRSTRSRSLSTSKVTVKEESDESVSSRTANDATSVSQQQQNVSQRSQRRRRKPKRWDDDSDDNTDTTSDRNNASLNKENEKQSEEEEEEEDPDKLWCICRRPHNNRFMICCDICEEWFHGKCVGVSVRQNKSFEKQGIKWLCPGCKQENESGASATTTTTTTTTAITNDKSPIKTEPIPFENTPIKEESDDEAMDDLSKDSPTNDSSGPLQSPLKSDADNLTSPPSISIASPKKSSIKSKQTSNEYSSNRKILSKKVNRDERDMKIGDVLRQRKLKEAGSKAAAIERKEANRLRKLIKSSKTSLKLKIDKSNKSHKHSETPQTPDAEKQENKWEPISKVVPLTKKVEEKKKKPKNTPMDFSFNDLFKADAPVMMTKKITPTSYASPTTPNTPNTPSSKRPILPGNTQQKKPIVEQNCVNCGKIVPKNSIRGKETSVYCSEPCLEKHVKASFDFVKQAKSSSSSSSSSVSPASSGLKTSKSRINLYDRITGRLLSEMVEFNEDKILEYIKNNPTYDIMKPKVVRRQSSSSQPSESESKKKDPSKVTSSQSKGSSSVKRIKEESSLSRQKSSESNSSKPVDKKEEPSGEMVRTKVRLELKQILLQRSKEANLKIVTEEVAKIAEKIEEELFNYFNKDPGQKYRTRFRSLRYNLSDTKNQGLFRKVLNSTINPVRLVRMSPEELAHSELAKWREREAKHSLEMIKRDAEAAAQQVIVKKTHKGEEVIEKKASLETLDPASDEELAKSNAKSNSTPPTTAPVSKEKPFLAGLELLGDGSLGDAEDNTDKHGQHLFDLHCKKCTNQNTNDSSTSLSHKNKTPPSSSSDSKPPQPKRVRVEFDEPTTKIYEEALKLSKTKKSREKLRMKVDDHKASASDSSTSTNQVKKQPLESCWKGFIHMPEVAKFVANAHTVHGLPDNKLKDVPDSINVVGRIAPEQALDYLRKKSPQDITVVKFVPVNLEERSGYEEFFRYLFQRKRYGVVDSANSKNIKDFYILPLPKDQEPPEAITPFNGPGLGGNRRNLLIGVLVRNRKPSIKTPAKDKPPSNGTKVKFEVQESSPSEKPERSYTPPPPEMSVQNETPNDEPYDPAIGLTPPQPPPPSEENDPPPPAPPPPQEEKPVDESEPYDPEENDLNFNCSIPFLSPSVFVNSTKFNFI